MRAYYQAPLDEQYRDRYSGVGAGTTSSKDQRFTNPEQARTQPTVDRLKEQANQAARTRNVQVQGKNVGGARAGGNTSSGQTIDQSFSQSYAQQGLQPSYAQQVTDTRKSVTRKQQVEYQKAQRRANRKKPMVVRAVSKVPGGQVAGAVANFGLTQFARARATVINSWLIAWGLWFWLIIQVPLALLLVFAIGLAGFIHQLLLDVDPTKTKDAEGGTVFSSVIDGIGRIFRDTVLEVVIAVVKLITGFDLTQFNPSTFVTMIYGINVAFGVIALLSVYIAYRFSFIRPLSGRAAGAKYAAVAIALAMYSVPIANLLPWFMLWCVVVWFFPR